MHKPHTDPNRCYNKSGTASEHPIVRHRSRIELRGDWVGQASSCEHRSLTCTSNYLVNGMGSQPWRLEHRCTSLTRTIIRNCFGTSDCPASKQNWTKRRLSWASVVLRTQKSKLYVFILYVQLLTNAEDETWGSRGQTVAKVYLLHLHI
jgi:hypothetical protein